MPFCLRLSKIEHPNIVAYVGLCTEPKYIIVTEYVPRGELKVLLQKKKKELSLFQRLKMARDAALGVSWLHYNDIIHRDIKPENMLVDSHYRVKGTLLFDF